jgi:cytochrome oxidase Cu insertion factor (SCO1/SenC/PrrC family)
MRLKITIAVATLIVGFGCSAVREPASNDLAPRTSPVQVGEMAPDFTLQDQNQQKIRLSSARGKPAVLVFYRGYW